MNGASDQAVPERSRRQWEALAAARVAQGEPGTAVEADFIRQGLDPSTARVILNTAVQQVQARAWKLLIGSAIVVGIGVVVTVVSFFVALTTTGGDFWIWFGPIICGGIVFLVALVRLMRIQR